MNSSVNAVQTEFPAEYEDPFAPGVYTHDVTVGAPSTTYTLSFKEASLIQRYNGARGQINLGGPHAFAWEFDPAKPAGERWIFDINENNHVFKVVEHHHDL